MKKAPHPFGCGARAVQQKGKKEYCYRVRCVSDRQIFIAQIFVVKHILR